MRALLPSLPFLLLTPIAAQEIFIPEADSARSSTATPWSSTTLDRRQMRAHPARSLDALLTLVTGVSRVNDALHIRGSRSGEIEFRLNGLSVLDRWSNSNGIPFIPEMLERITVHTGAYGAELGSAGGGIVDMQLREGGEQFTAEASILTDDLQRPGKQFLGTSSYGWTTAVATIGTPLPVDTRLLIAGEISRKDNRLPMYLDPIDLTLEPDPIHSAFYPLPPSPFRIERNHVPSQAEERMTLQWNMVTRGLGPEVSFFGSMSTDRTREVTWPSAVSNYYRQQRIPWVEGSSTILAAKVSHTVGRRLALEGSAAYSRRTSHISDPDFGEAWRLYTDSVANASRGYEGFLTRYYGPRGYSAIIYFFFGQGSTPNNRYRREEREAWQGFLRARWRLTDSWTVSGGWEYEQWTLRKFSIGLISSYLHYVDGNSDGQPDHTFLSTLEERAGVKDNGFIESYGYSHHGTEVSDGLDAPRNPSMAAVTLESDWTDDAWTVKAGLRAQRYSLDMTTLPSSTTAPPGTDPLEPYLITASGIFDESRLEKQASTTLVFPRLSVIHHSESAVISASHGSFAEILPLSELHIDNHRLARLASRYRVPYNLGGQVVTYSAQPSRTTQTEIGIQLTPVKALSGGLNAFRKKTKDQIQLGRLWPMGDTSAVPLIGLMNAGESVNAGTEAWLRYRPNPMLEVGVSYAWSHFRGIGSSPRSNQLYVSDLYAYSSAPPPELPFLPLEYEREHRILGSVTYSPGEEGPLGGLELAAYATIESGRPYTREPDAPRFVGSANIWMIGVWSVREVRVSAPQEPLLSSRTPWMASFDVSVSYRLAYGPSEITLFAFVTNVLDTRNVANVYPSSGNATNDGWLGSQFATGYKQYPQYEQFYTLLNLQNRWAYMSATGNDMLGRPRQLRVGVSVNI